MAGVHSENNLNMLTALQKQTSSFLFTLRIDFSNIYGVQWQVSYSYTPLSDREDGAIFKVVRVLGDDLEKIAIYILGTHVPQTKNYNTW